MAVTLQPGVIEDPLSGLTLRIVEGEYLNWISIERTPEVPVRRRDFYFTKDGVFDGAGSATPISFPILGQDGEEVDNRSEEPGNP